MAVRGQRGAERAGEGAVVSVVVNFGWVSADGNRYRVAGVVRPARRRGYFEPDDELRVEDLTLHRAGVELSVHTVALVEACDADALEQELSERAYAVAAERLLFGAEAAEIAEEVCRGG